MRSIIEELYYGNISPTDRDIIRGGTYSHILNLVTRNEVSVKGVVSAKLLAELLSDEPSDKSIYNKMTKYFTINVENERCFFCSAHYGTEMYLERVSDEDILFFESVVNQYDDCFSVSIDKE